MGKYTIWNPHRTVLGSAGYSKMWVGGGDKFPPQAHIFAFLSRIVHNFPKISCLFFQKFRPFFPKNFAFSSKTLPPKIGSGVGLPPPTKSGTGPGQPPAYEAIFCGLRQN
jgi:hypothetical protein